MQDAPEEGMPAPNFTLQTSNGDVDLSRFAGGWLVLFFYPRDDTPGCTTEAKEFSALQNQFAASGASLLGVSKDTVAKHEKFIAKHELSAQLGSDATGNVCESYGVWVEKKMYGRASMGIARTTFLIDPEGQVARIWRKVKPAGHAQAVLAELQNLTNT